MDRFTAQKNDGTFIDSQCKYCKFNIGHAECEKNAQTIDILKNNIKCPYYEEIDEETKNFLNLEKKLLRSEYVHISDEDEWSISNDASDEHKQEFYQYLKQINKGVN